MSWCWFNRIVNTSSRQEAPHTVYPMCPKGKALFLKRSHGVDELAKKAFDMVYGEADYVEYSDIAPGKLNPKAKTILEMNQVVMQASNDDDLLNYKK